MDIRSGSGPLAFEVDVRCVRCEREQTIRWWGDQVLKEEVVMHAGLIDGSMFSPPPGPESPLCKCGICGGELLAVVRDVREKAAAPAAAAG
jgi:hypothetical protein